MARVELTNPLDLLKSWLRALRHAACCFDSLKAVLFLCKFRPSTNLFQFSCLLASNSYANYLLLPPIQSLPVTPPLYVVLLLLFRHCSHSQTPRYSTLSTTTTPRRDDSSYSYSKTVRSETSSSSADPYTSRPTTSTSSYTSTSERDSRGGPGGYSYNTERTSTTGSGPGGYSYSSTTSGRLPHGTTYRHYSYRV